MASIQKRVRNGKVSYSVRYRDPAGRSRRKDFPRRADAERWLVANEAAKLKGGWVDPAAGRLLFREQAERWYATTAALRPATRRDYRKSLDLYVLPTFGDLPLASIDPLAVREWQAALAVGTSPGRDGKALGAKRRAKALAVLRMVLASAVEAGRLARNPAETVKPPKVQRREVRFLDPVQVELLADCIDPRWRVMVLFTAYTGLRPEELTALRVEHLDLLRGTARVCEAAPEIDGRLCWGGVKTHEARTVRLPRFLVEELAAYLAGRPHEPGDLVFTAPLGGPLRWSKWVKTYFKPAIARANEALTAFPERERPAPIPQDLRLYDLRHTAASLAIREGASVKAVQAQLGHKTATMTLDLYGHLFPDEAERVAERLDARRAAALATRHGEVWPQRGPAVVPLRRTAGQEG